MVDLQMADLLWHLVRPFEIDQFVGCHQIHVDCQKGHIKFALFTSLKWRKGQ